VFQEELGRCVPVFERVLCHRADGGTAVVRPESRAPGEAGVCGGSPAHRPARGGTGPGAAGARGRPPCFPSLTLLTLLSALSKVDLKNLLPDSLESRY